MPITWELFAQVKRLRNELRRERHRCRELEKRLAQARQCIQIQAEKNYQVYLWHRDAPPDFQILEVPNDYE